MHPRFELADVIGPGDGPTTPGAHHQQLAVFRGLGQMVGRVAHDNTLGDVRSAHLLHGVVEAGSTSNRTSGRTIDGVTARIAHRLLALTATIWHNRATVQPVTRSPIAYDH
jgi:hypothetical protein